jgi:Trypsin
MVTLGKAVKGVTPVTLPGLGYLDTLNLRTQTFTLVGYGTEGLHGGVSGSSGTRMYTDVSAKKGQSVSVRDEYLLVSGMGSSSGACFGDSGGASLAGDTLVATITGGNGLCSDWTYATRVDTQAAIDFIRQNR